MAPTTDALVQLTEPPFTVITLEEIEVAHLERIQIHAVTMILRKCC
jgi:nucleosome binding factor SPN SPT16 subunit